MTDEKTIREFIQNKLNEKSRRELTYIETVYDLQEFCKHLQTEAINYTRCCKSDSELLLFSADEIVSKINEQTVLDGETFRVYFREK
jgi:hypothetical protein